MTVVAKQPKELNSGFEMEYNITEKMLPNSMLAATLRTLAGCYAEIGAELYVVGATARDIALRMLDVDVQLRGTLDLDVAVSLEQWEQFQRLSEILQCHHFIKAPEQQRFRYVGEDGCNGYIVDIVPFGGIAVEERVAWPPEGSPVMSVRCFNDVMKAADTVRVESGYSFRMASLSGQFLLKLDAWQDRHLQTKKDADDMVYILQNAYVAYALSRNRLPDEIDLDAEQFNLMVAGAEWIASDLNQILTVSHRRYYAQLLSEEVEKAEESELINDMLDVSDSRHYQIYRRALSRMSQILA